MADQLTPEQIAEIFEQYRKSQETLEDAQKKFGMTLGKSAVQLTSSLYKGEKGVGQFGDAVESAATALQLLILAIPGLGLAAKVAAVAIGALGKAANLAAKQGDVLFKTYQDLSRVGSTAADGISGVFSNMQKFGYGIEELDKMVALVTENSKTLATFSLTAADGARAFADGMSQIQRDQQLRDLGKTTDDINSAGAAFIRQQTMMGRRQFDVQGQLGERTRAYVLELDRLQRLTGRSADDLQKQQEELLSEDEYVFYLKSLEQQGEAGRAQAQKMREVTSFFPEYSKLIAQAIGGNLEAAQQLNFIAPSLIKNLRDPLMSTNQVIMEFEREGKRAGDMFGPLAGLYSGATRDVIGPLNQLYTATARAADINERTSEVERQRMLTDPSTKNLAAAQISNMNARDALQSMVQLGVAPATFALSKLAGAAAAVSTTGATAIGAPGAGGQRGAFSYDRARSASSDVDRILSTIRQRESSGNYGAQAPGSSASGAYQFIDSTWQSMTKKFGMGEEYSSAKLAPKDIQDAIAKAYVKDILKRAGGDVSKVPLEWYTGNLQGKMTPEQLRKNNGLTSEMYQSNWMKEFQNQPGAATQQDTNSQFSDFFSQMLDKFSSFERLQRDQRDLQQKQLQATN
jgi:hypothetical protein